MNTLTLPASWSYGFRRAGIDAAELVGERAVAEHLDPAAPDRLGEGAPAAADGQDGVGVEHEAGVGAVGGTVSVDLARPVRAGTDVELAFGESDFDDSAAGEAVQRPQQRQGEPVRPDRVRGAPFTERGSAPFGECGEDREQSAAVLGQFVDRGGRGGGRRRRTARPPCSMSLSREASTSVLTPGRSACRSV